MLGRILENMLIKNVEKSTMEQISQLVLAGGERYPMLVDSEGMPDFWVTLYVTELLRPGHKQTSIENSIRHLIHLKLWEAINDRDLIGEFSAGKFLSDSDIISIRDHCLLKTPSLRAWHESSRTKKVSAISLRHPTSTRHLEIVCKGHTSNRLAHIAAFLHFTARTLLRERSDFTSLTGAIDDMKERIIAQKPKGGGKSELSNDPNTKAPPPGVFKKLMLTVKEDSPDNPYKSSGVRVRNALMFDVLDETGMRAAEVLALQIDDIDYQAGAIKVVRRHDNPNDPRKRQPVPKTLERNIPVSLSLVRRIRDYVMNVRPKVLGANKGPFVFVTHKRGKFQGYPISDSTFRNRILGPATATSPELFDEICRHGYRHNFNYRLSTKIDAHNLKAKSDPTIKPIDKKEESQIRMYLNGWASEDTAKTYNLRHIQELANKLQRDDMDNLSTYLAKAK